MDESIIEKLTSKDDKLACAFAEEMIQESKASDRWYPYFDTFSALLRHPKSYVRNRAMGILAALAPWDEENRFDSILPEFLSHITDDKPITARQCVKALSQIGRVKPQYIPEILDAFSTADLRKYRDTMRPLIENDMAQTKKLLLNGEESL